jgi:hypothetical protein
VALSQLFKLEVYLAVEMSHLSTHAVDLLLACLFTEVDFKVALGHFLLQLLVDHFLDPIPTFIVTLSVIASQEDFPLTEVVQGSHFFDVFLRVGQVVAYLVDLPVKRFQLNWFKLEFLLTKGIESENLPIRSIISANLIALASLCPSTCPFNFLRFFILWVKARSRLPYIRYFYCF